jgi:hypothetical protein
LGVTVDGTAVPKPRTYRVVLAPFTLRFQPGNVFDVRAGAYRSIAAGWFFMLKPLPRGEHVVVASARDPEFPVGGLARLTVRLTVE